MCQSGVVQDGRTWVPGTLSGSVGGWCQVGRVVVVTLGDRLDDPAEEADEQRQRPESDQRWTVARCRTPSGKNPRHITSGQ